MEKIVERLKKETNNLSDIIYRIKYINDQKIYIIYNEPLVSSDKISDFIIRSLDHIDEKYKKKIDLYSVIKNDINNFKVTDVKNYKDIVFYLHNGFTIILFENATALAFETKRNLSRSIASPTTETTLRGPNDAFVEDIQTNTGLIKRRIKTNDLWIENLQIGRNSNTRVSIFYMNNITDKKLVNEVKKQLEKIDIDNIIDSGTIKNLIEKENKNAFPTIATSERPDRACNAILEGKVVIVVDTSPFVLILPNFLNDIFKSTEDKYGKAINVSFTRIIRFFAFFITLLTPGVYIAITTYNQEMLPTELLISFASQRSLVPFPAFFEALLMILSFEILRESDLRIPNFSSSALSIVGALILGEAAVNAGIVSPIMIIVISVTAISALIFSEPEVIYAIRIYRILFMLGAAFMGLIGVIFIFIFFILKLSSLNSFGKPYLMPYAPTYISGLKNSFIRLSTNKQTNRLPYLSKSKTKYRSDTK